MAVGDLHKLVLLAGLGMPGKHLMIRQVMCDLNSPVTAGIEGFPGRCPVAVCTWQLLSGQGYLGRPLQTDHPLPCNQDLLEGAYPRPSLWGLLLERRGACFVMGLVVGWQVAWL